jgi:hypothetical protein
MEFNKDKFLDNQMELIEEWVDSTNRPLSYTFYVPKMISKSMKSRLRELFKVRTSNDRCITHFRIWLKK